MTPPLCVLGKGNEAEGERLYERKRVVPPNSGIKSMENHKRLGFGKITTKFFKIA